MLDNTESSSFVLVNDELSTNEDELESSFSLISDIIDDGSSFLSFCDDVLGEIELVPTLRCYKHSRNVKLNRLLDVAVILSFALVTGLGIGNFIGHATNCAVPRPVTSKFQCPADPHFILETAFIHGIRNPIKEQGCSADCMKSVTGVVNYSNVDARNKNQNDDHDTVISEERNEISYPAFLKNTSDESISAGNKQPVVMYGLSLAHSSQDFVKKSKLDSSLKIDIHEFQGLHFQMSKESTYSDLLSILNNGIADIFHKMQNLVSTIVNDDNCKSNDLQSVNDMFERFHNSIKEKASELNGFILSGFLEDTAFGRKQFMKMSYTIIKSIDKLLENSFFKILIKDKYPLSSRLKKMSEIGLSIMKELEKRWSYRKKKLLGYIKEDMKHFGNVNIYNNIIKYEKHHSKFKKQKSDSVNYNIKHPYLSHHFKPPKIHFNKKKCNM